MFSGLATIIGGSSFCFQAVAALAITQEYEFKGTCISTAVMVFSAPTTNGDHQLKIMHLDYENDAKRLWRRSLPKVAAFYTDRLLKNLAAQVDPSGISGPSQMSSPLKCPLFFLEFLLCMEMLIRLPPYWKGNQSITLR